jgi:UDP-N-acetylmuramoyl-tripeptide--D-alanyl-D-alanine ligase
MNKGMYNIKTYGTKDAEITGSINNSSEFLEVQITRGANINSIKTHLVGSYNLPNVLAAVALGKYFNIGDEKIKTALENYLPSNSRSQLIEKDGNKIILDAYNANPSSMKAAIENFVKMQGQNKILLLGGMMEMGDESVAEHSALVDLISKYQWQEVVLVGGDFNKTVHPYKYFNNSTEAKTWLHEQHLENALLLIKGSRSMQMEKVLE